MSLVFDKTIKVEDKEFHLIKWDLRKTMRNNNIVMPLIKDPVVNAIAMSDSDNEDVVVLSIIEGVITSLEGIDLEKLAERLLEGIYFTNENGIKKEANLDILAAAGCTMADVLVLCVNVIQLNYGDLLKKDLLASLTTTLGS